MRIRFLIILGLLALTVACAHSKSSGRGTAGARIKSAEPIPQAEYPDETRRFLRMSTDDGSQLPQLPDSACEEEVRSSMELPTGTTSRLDEDLLRISDSMVDDDMWGRDEDLFLGDDGILHMRGSADIEHVMGAEGLIDGQISNMVIN